MTMCATVNAGACQGVKVVLVIISVIAASYKHLQFYSVYFYS